LVLHTKVIHYQHKYRLLNTLRDEGLLFDAIRRTLECDGEGIQEITWEEYEVLERAKKIHK